MILIRYRLFHIGKKLFFQILEQNKKLDNNLRSHVFFTPDFKDITYKVNVSRVNCPCIGRSLDEKNAINIFLRGNNVTRDMDVTEVNLCSVFKEKDITDGNMNEFCNELDVAVHEHIRQLIKMSPEKYVIDGLEVIYAEYKEDIDNFLLSRK